MLIRFKIWRARRQTAVLSKYTDHPLTAWHGSIPLGKFQNGKEVI